MAEFASGRGARVVIKDASFRSHRRSGAGFAGLAVVLQSYVPSGASADYSMVTSASSSADAEMRALLWAFELADHWRMERVDFVSDHNPVPDPPAVAEWLARRPAWRVVAVPRAFVWRADRLARTALRGWR